MPLFVLVTFKNQFKSFILPPPLFSWHTQMCQETAQNTTQHNNKKPKKHFLRICVNYGAKRKGRKKGSSPWSSLSGSRFIPIFVHVHELNGLQQSDHGAQPLSRPFIICWRKLYFFLLQGKFRMSDIQRVH